MGDLDRARDIYNEVIEQSREKWLPVPGDASEPSDAPKTIAVKQPPSDPTWLACLRIAALEVQIRGHCALLTGGTTHTENPTDCLGQVQEFITTLEAERDEARRLLERLRSVIMDVSDNRVLDAVDEHLEGPASDGGAGS